MTAYSSGLSPNSAAVSAMGLAEEGALMEEGF
jgi:hypothetical protein